MLVVTLIFLVHDMGFVRFGASWLARECMLACFPFRFSTTPRFTFSTCTTTGSTRMKHPLEGWDHADFTKLTLASAYSTIKQYQRAAACNSISHFTVSCSHHRNESGQVFAVDGCSYNPPTPSSPSSHIPSNVSFDNLNCRCLVTGRLMNVFLDVLC